MLTKIIELGYEVPETGEPRVRLIQGGLVKTASTEIQSFWDSIKQDGDSAYLWVIGVSAKEYYGCNNNGDAFAEEDLKRTHTDFVSTAHVFLQHVNKDPAKSIGRPVFSWYNDAMHRVELILKIDKANPGSAATVAKIRNGEPIFVSMGCTVAYDVCSICGNKAPTRKEYCDHLRYNMKKILPDGRQVYALNPNPKFFDISIVGRPADPTAFTLDKLASIGCRGGMAGMPTSAELGEVAEDLSLKVASLKKMSDIVKRVDGQVADAKDGGVADAVRAIREAGFQHMAYPEMPYAQLHGMGVSPAGLISCLTALGAPVTLGDAAWMAGRHAYGHCPTRSEYHDMFSLLPAVLGRLVEHPEMVGGIVRRVWGSYNGECDEPARRTIILRVIRPVAEARIQIINGLGTRIELQKLAAALGQQDEDGAQFGHTIGQQLVNDFRPRKENFTAIVLRDRHGNEAVTTPYHLRQTLFAGEAANKLFAKPTIAAALALGSIGAVLMQPDLLRKALALTAMGIPAAAMVNWANADATYRDGITTSEGDAVSDQMVASAWKTQKTAGLGKPRLGTMAGMALPGAMALDYAYNQWKYGPYGNPNGDSLLTRLGGFVAEHPATTALAGGLVGSQAGRLGSALLKARRMARTVK
jgi:hypothetical protein